MTLIDTLKNVIEEVNAGLPAQAVFFFKYEKLTEYKSYRHTICEYPLNGMSTVQHTVLECADGLFISEELCRTRADIKNWFDTLLTLQPYPMLLEGGSMQEVFDKLKQDIEDIKKEP